MAKPHTGEKSMQVRTMILSALAAATLLNTVPARAVLYVNDESHDRISLGLGVLNFAIGVVFEAPVNLAIGVLLLDDKSGTAQFKEISPELAREANITPQELAAFNSSANLAIVNASLDNVSHELQSGAVSQQNANARFIETIQSSCSSEAMQAYFKVKATVTKKR
jgi:hypothetical protein